ncbi:MAG: hypothetical protein F4220_02120, partial [Gammaproteobacteria bacterium]|nr:hypothetical protein [Gammaproteobacteria bacterium]
MPITALSYTIGRHARKLVQISVSQATLSAYSRALTRLETALDGQTLTDSALADYIAGLHAAGLSPASAGLVVAAVRFAARVNGESSP